MSKRTKANIIFIKFTVSQAFLYFGLNKIPEKTNAPPKIIKMMVMS